MALTQLVPIAHRIWDMKYRLRDAAGAAVDGTVDDTWRRVARALAAAERAPGAWEGPFHAALDGFRFLPAGRILAGAGTGRDVTLFNCFVMGSVPDDMGGIFAHLREAALTLQQGGGIGYDFSTLRPRGAPVKSVGADASGPLSFMDVWDAMCRTVMSAGYRRGAMMATLACDHPDIEAFIDAKRMPGRLTMFNLSVLASDAFMAAVEADAPWNLTFGGSVARTLRARELWDRIMAATYANAEPGVIFIDRINAENNLGWLETIRATNPCGEQPLPPYGACLLGSLDLARLVDKPFTAEAHIPDAAFARLVPVAVRMLDNAIDVSRFPLPAQRDEALAKRRIGLGVTGLADALALCGARYGSREAVALTERWLAAIARHAYLASAALAAEKGAFSLYERDRFLAAPFVRRLPQEVRDAIAANGIRNGLLTSIAPAGTISLLAGNLSSGIEPIYAFDYERALLMPDGERRRERVEDWAVRLWRETQGEDAPLPQFFVDAQSLAPGDHLVMQAAAQKWVDSSISKTVNVPEDIAFDAFKDIYLQAWRLGCKGCTTYRPNDVTGSVLATTTEAAKPAAAPAEAPRKGFGDVYEAGGVVWMTRSLDRPEALPGRTYKIRWSDSDQAIYITLNDIVREGRRAPFEVFINSKNMEHYAWTVALTRMISAVFRRGGDVSFMVEELKAVFDPRGGQWLDGRYVPSLLAAIGEVIERHMVDIGFLPAREAGAVGQAARAAAAAAGDRAGSAVAALTAAAATSLRQCPRCGAAALVRQENCDVCLDCGHSKCA